MAEVQHTVLIAAPLPVVWDFVKDMDNWAPFLTGYQRHEKQNDDESLWFLKGELGGLTRIAEFRVKVTEWAGPERVNFELEGINEPVTGSGSFLSTAIGDAPAPPPVRRGWLSRQWDWLRRKLFDRIFGITRNEPVPVAAGPAESQVTFKLALRGGGATGPLMMLLIAPMLQPVAEDLANKIAARINEREKV